MSGLAMSTLSDADVSRGHIWIPTGVHRGMNIERHPLESAGRFTGGGKKIVPHTTEGPRESVDVAVNVLKVKRAAPHFVLGWRRGFLYPVLIQTVALDEAGRALEHNEAPETNRANAWQLEICGYTFGRSDAAMTVDRHPCHDWDENWMHAIANVWRIIHLNTGAPLHVNRTFQKPVRYSNEGWVRAETIAGHCHAPQQTHVDPTTLRATHIAKLASEGFQEIRPRH